MFNDAGIIKKSVAIKIIPAMSNFTGGGLVTLSTRKKITAKIKANTKILFTVNVIHHSIDILGFKTPIIDNTGNISKAKILCHLSYPHC